MTALVSCCLSAAGIRFLGILSRPGIPPLLRSAYRTAHKGGTDPDGVSMFRTRETQLGPGALSTPGTAVPATARCNPWPPHAASQRPVPATPVLPFPPRGAQITGHQQGFTGVHPSQPFPRL